MPIFVFRNNPIQEMTKHLMSASTNIEDTTQLDNFFRKSV